MHKAWIVCSGVDEDMWLKLVGQFAFLTASFHFREDIISDVLSSDHLVLSSLRGKGEPLRYRIFPSGINAQECLE